MELSPKESDGAADGLTSGEISAIGNSTVYRGAHGSFVKGVKYCVFPSL